MKPQVVTEVAEEVREVGDIFSVIYWPTLPLSQIKYDDVIPHHISVIYRVIGDRQFEILDIKLLKPGEQHTFIFPRPE